MSIDSIPARQVGTHDAASDYRTLLVQQWRSQLDDVTRLSMEVAAQREAGQDGAAGAGTEYTSVAVRLLASARRQMEETEGALLRLEKGSFGLCDRCRLPIPPARLEALPTARLCVPCQATRHA